MGVSTTVTYDGATIQRICGRLRRLVQDAFQKHLYVTAVFYADKLWALTEDVEDLYTLAECYFKNREYRRVLHLLRRNADSVSKDQRFKLIVAQSLMECRDWEEAIRYLEEVTTSDLVALDSRMASTLAFLRGKVYEVTENQENALIWYERALQLDPYCHEALERLIGNHLLTAEKEVQLLRNLQFHEEDEWLRHLHAAKLAAVRGVSGESVLSNGSWLAPGAPNAPSATVAAVAPQSGSVDVDGSFGQEILKSRARQRRMRQAIHDGKYCTAEEYPAPCLPAALASNGHALAAQSTRYFYEGDYESCYLVSKRVLETDPYFLAVLPVHIAALVMLDMKSAVFYVAHQLVNAYPNSAVAWFTAGCYYFLVKKYEPARRFFHKALSLDHSFAPAWIAYGHAFASHDESDQALAAYRTASRLFPGSHLPWLFIGMEYLKTNSLQLAQQCLQCASSLVPSDPHVYNEIAVVAFQRRHFAYACDLLRHALQLPGAPLEVICANLGHAFLKCKVYDRALEAFRQAMRLNSRNASVLSGVAFTLQLQGRPDDAIEYYHRALSLHRADSFAADMLSYAVQEAAERPMAV